MTGVSPEKPTLCDLAWAAGFIDGEGCVSVAKSTRKGQPLPYYRADLSASNTVRAPLEKLSAMFGGRVVVVRAQVGKRRVSYAWKTSGTSSTAAVLRQLLPWLMVKRRQAELVLEFAQFFGTIRHQQKKPDRPQLEILKQRMHALNARGVA